MRPVLPDALAYLKEQRELYADSTFKDFGVQLAAYDIHQRFMQIGRIYFHTDLKPF